jgi:squalene-hopene/tetraprenyl-beta-curcumene cyclase
MTVMCFSEAEKQKPGKYKQLLAAAERYLKGIQYDESEGEDRSSTNYGGGGYGHEKRPDLSNTGMLVDALKSLGRGPEDEAIQKALIFVSRCQNLETEHNDTKWASKNPDGSFYYTCADGGSSPAKWPEGVSEEVRGLRGYGAMTYVGLKSLIYAGVSKDDPRVKAATRWIQKNYSLDVNPGLGQNGLYYYFQTFGKAFDAIGEDAVVDAKGVKHHWRAELVQKLASLQNEDGSWINESPRWFEGDPNLATGHALLALSHCRPRKKAATSVIEK